MTINFSQEELKNKCINEDHLKEITQSFSKNGYLIIKNIFPSAFITSLKDLFFKTYSNRLEDREYNDVLEVGNKRKQITIKIQDSFNSPELYANPMVMPILSNLLSDNFVISDFTCVISLPEAKAMAIHNDGSIFRESAIAKLLPAHAIGLLIPLIPFNNQNGVTRLYPGTHRNPKTSEEHLKSKNFIDPELDIGSCILMDYRLQHRGNPNLSTDIRPLLYCNYSVPWYLDVNNFKKQAHLILDDENYSRIPDDHKHLFIRRNIKLSK